MHNGQKDVLEKLRSAGYCVIANFLSPYECERLTKHIDSCMTKYADKVQRDFKEGLGGDYRLFGLETSDQVIYDTLYNNGYLDVLKTYANNPETTPCTVMAGVIEASTDGSRINSGGTWHRDPGTQYGTKVKSIIYLTDVGLHNGPFTIIPNSLVSDVGVGRTRSEDCPRIHEGLRICDDFIEELATQGKIPVEITGRAGTMILVDVGNIHMGKAIEEGKRYSLTNYFGNSQRSSDSFKRNKKHFIE